FLRRGPILWHWQPLRPRQPAIATALHHNRAAPVPLGINRNDRFVVRQQHRRDVAEVLPSLAIYDYLMRLVLGEVDQRNGVAVRQGLRRQGTRWLWVTVCTRYDQQQPRESSKLRPSLPAVYRLHNHSLSDHCCPAQVFCVEVGERRLASPLPLNVGLG